MAASPVRLLEDVRDGWANDRADAHRGSMRCSSRPLHLVWAMPESATRADGRAPAVALLNHWRVVSWARR
jgi:hypothetical protein